MKYNPALDGLRAIAILFVFIGHIFPSYLHTAWTGVEIFFVLSGYLITGTLLHHQDYIYFYKRRILRILPALSIFLFVFLIVSYFLDIKTNNQYLLSSLFFYSNWLLAFDIEPINYLTHLWSLALEEQFYLVFPWLLLIFVCYPKALLCMFLLCFGYKFHMFQVEWSFVRLYYGTDTRLSSFLLGAILYFIHTGKMFLNLNFKSTYVNLISAVAFFALLCISLHTLNKNALFWGFLSNIWIAILILFSCAQYSMVNRILSCKILRWIGQLSFGLYLWHYPIIFYLNENYSMMVVLGLGLPLSFLCAMLSYYYMEKPLLAKHKRTA